MASYAVGSTPVRVDLPMDAMPLIQNLGPDPIWFDTGTEDPVNEGVRIDVGQAFEFPEDMNHSGAVWLAAGSEGNDVRVVRVG